MSSARARSAVITAKGFSSRRLRTRSSATAAVLVASHARWKPPRPFTATINPRPMASAAAAIGSGEARSRPSGPASQSRGPQAGHALGWAWNRRSDGEEYSDSHAGHIRNGAIVVFGRS